MKKTETKTKTHRDELIGSLDNNPIPPASSGWVAGVPLTVGGPPTEDFQSDVNPLETPEGVAGYKARINEVVTPSFAAFSTVPVRPNLLNVPALRTQFASGLYLAPARTGAGKTLNSIALSIALKDVADVDVAYHYVFEARSISPAKSDRPEDAEEAAGRAASASVKGMVSIMAAMKRAAAQSSEPNPVAELMGDPGVERVAMFKDPSRLLSDLKFIYGSRTPQSKLTFVVIDSLTLAIKQSYPMERSGSAAGEKGSQPADIKFIFELSRFCLTHNLICLGLVNSELVQFTNILEGVCEGQLNLLGAGQFQKRDRISRQWQNVTIAPAYFKQALNVLGYTGTGSANDGERASTFSEQWTA